MKDSYEWLIVDIKHGKSFRFKTLDELLVFAVKLAPSLNINFNAVKEFDNVV